MQEAKLNIHFVICYKDESSDMWMRKKYTFLALSSKLNPNKKGYERPIKMLVPFYVIALLKYIGITIAVS